MLYTDFCEELNICIDNGDYSSANQMIMHELGQTLVQNKKDFVDLLNQSGVSASINDSDIYLIETFVNNLPINKKLMLGSSLLVNIKNQQSNFNGTQELNDDDVKNGYHVMRTYFIDNYSIHDKVTAASYVSETLPLLNKAFENFNVVVLVGGSGMYIDALCYGLDDLPVNQMIKNDLRIKYFL
jgi:hypothetical protein